MLRYNMVDEHTMMPGKTRTERLGVLVRRQEQIAARIKELEAQVETAKRKADTRRKIVLGGGVLARANAGPGPARDVVCDAVRHMSRRDRDAFEEAAIDWLRDVLTAAKAADERAAQEAGETLDVANKTDGEEGDGGQ